MSSITKKPKGLERLGNSGDGVRELHHEEIRSNSKANAKSLGGKGERKSATGVTEKNGEEPRTDDQIKLLSYEQDDDEDDDLNGSTEDIDGDENEEGDLGDEHNQFPTLAPADDSDDNVAKKKAGIIYVGNLPPGMKPHFLKSLLMTHGEIKRFYLEPEDDAKRKRRVALGGSGGLRYTEGWVEFENKRDAKDVAEQLNGTRIGRKKGSRFYDDLWMIKYLKGFTWQMLVEKSVIQRKEREQRLRLELSRAKKEDEAFLQSVARAKKFKMREQQQSDQPDALPDKKPVEQQFKRSLPKQLAPIVDKTKRLRSNSTGDDASIE